MQGYIINFFYWWYLVRGEQVILATIKKIIFLLESTNTLTMARNLTVPLFQDNTGMGKLFAIILRSGWVWFGGMFALLLSIPVVVKALAFLLIPVLVIMGVFINIANLVAA